MTVGLLAYARRPVIAPQVGGLAFVNPTLYPNADFPLIDVFQHADRVWECSSSGARNYSGTNFGVLNATGLPTAMPPGVDQMRTYLELWPLTAGDSWVMEWTGAGDIALGSAWANLSANVISSNRIEYTFTGYQNGTDLPRPIFAAFVNITSVTSPFTQIRIYPKSLENRLKVEGKITNPDFVSFYSQFKGIRFMNWLNVNGGCDGDVNMRTLEGMSPSMFRGDMYLGVPTRDTAGTNDFTAPSAYKDNPSAWLKAMSLLTGPLSSVIIHQIAGITTGATTTVTTTVPHNMSSGQHYMFTLSNVFTNATGDYSNLFNKVFPITVTGPSTFVLNGLDSTGWTGTAPPTGMPSLRIKAGNLPYKDCFNRALDSFYNIIFNGPGEDANFEGYLKTAIQFVYDDIMDVLIPFNASGNTQSARGLPIETCVKIMNETGIDGWINIPMLASDAFIDYQANYCFNNVLPNLRTHVEPANEIWNISVGFNQSWYATRWAYKLYPGITGDQQARAEYTGVFAYRVHSRFTTVYAGHLSRLARVQATWASQFNNDGYHAWQLEAPNTDVAGLPKTVCDSYNYAPYIEPPRSVAPSAKMVYLFKTGDAPTKDAQLQALDQMFNASQFSGKGYITSDNKLHVTKVVDGEVDVGMQLAPWVSGVADGTATLDQTGGVANGVGTYDVSGPSQTIGSSGAPVDLSDTGVFTRKLMRNKMFPYFTRLCAKYGLTHGTYEWGWGPYPQFDNRPTQYLTPGDISDTDTEALWAAYHGSTYWGATSLQMMTDFKNAGGSYINYFTVTGFGWDIGTQFGEVIPGIYGDKTKPGYLAIQTHNNGG